MPVSQGLKTSLNKIRELNTDNYQRYVPIIEDDTDISLLSSPILNNPEVQNEFISSLINRIVYTQFETKFFRNPLRVLEGDRIPLGSAGQEIYVNPAKGRKFNGDDFAGILSKYEADVKVQYVNLNMDLQYPVSIQRQTLKKAFVSWGDLETFIEQLSNSLYNGAYIDQYKFTKYVMAGAYKDNKAIIETVTGVSDESTAKAFITRARELFLNFQTPSNEYNAWSKMGGYGRPITTWTNPEDIVFIISNKLRSYLDVNVLADAFNIDKTTLLGNIISVDNFDMYNDDGEKIFDGSKIVGMIADKSWFRIKEQDMFLDTAYNPNNRTYQYYLNVIKMYNFSLFANGVIFATEQPTVDITNLAFDETSVQMPYQANKIVNLKITPVNGSQNVTFTSSNGNVVKVHKINNSCVELKSQGKNGTATITASATVDGSTVSTTLPVKVVGAQTMFTITNTLASGVTNSNDATEVAQDESYEGTLSGVTTETVTVTMAGADVTNSVYTSATGKIVIDNVIGDIVITVA